MIRQIIRAATVAALTASAMALTSVPALASHHARTAAPTSASNHSGKTTPHCGALVCWYHFTDFRGDVSGASNPIASGDCYDFQDHSIGVGASAGNGTEYMARFWSGQHCTGISKLVWPQAEDPNLGFIAYSLGGY
ncbi:hypothetical protein [Fodinicola acaciae]|uniref:hypothetical protein n=1 Tax=Fodinicola acaciae TaxID=2681555 RepID=UPI0013D0AF37|nr:hypothetical protein [Fodinicola acaciae]